MSDYENIDEIDDNNDLLDNISETNEDEENILVEKEDFSKNEILDNYDIKNYTTFKQQPIACNKLTKYEKANILGIRAQQLANGAKPLIKDTSGYTNVIDIAKQELIEKKIPLIIKRPLCDGTYEYWKTEMLN